MDKQDIIILQRDIWAFRERMDSTPFVTPDVRSALRFACTESCEAMDANLRLTGGFARNNIREPDIAGELCDCYLMLITALGKNYIIESKIWDLGYPYDNASAIDYLCYMCALANFRLGSNILTLQDYAWSIEVEYALGLIIHILKDDLPGQMHKRMERIESKYRE